MKINENYNIIPCLREGYNFGPNAPSIEYSFTQSMWTSSLGSVTNLEIIASGSPSVSTNPLERRWEASGSLNGVSYKNRKYKMQVSSSVDVRYEGFSGWDLNNLPPEGENFTQIDVLLVAGGAAGGKTNGGAGGGGGCGGAVYTSSFNLVWGYTSTTMSLEIPQIGYSSSSYSTASLFTASFIAEPSVDYIVSASTITNPYALFLTNVIVGQGGYPESASAFIGNANFRYESLVPSEQTFYYTSSITFPNYGDLTLTTLTSSNEGIVYGIGADNESGSYAQRGLQWLDGTYYAGGGGAGGSFGGGGASIYKNGVDGGGNGGDDFDVATAGAANTGGGGGGVYYALGAGALGREGGSGIVKFRYYDPSGSLSSFGGEKTTVGDYVYHTFTASGVFGFEIPSSSIYT